MWLATETKSVAFACIFACAMQLALSGVFNVMLGLEDPFAHGNHHGHNDGVKVLELVENVRRQLLSVEREANDEWRNPQVKESW
jgi:hypothetical protein